MVNKILLECGIFIKLINYFSKQKIFGFKTITNKLNRINNVSYFFVIFTLDIGFLSSFYLIIKIKPFISKVLNNLSDIIMLNLIDITLLTRNIIFYIRNYISKNNLNNSKIGLLSINLDTIEHIYKYLDINDKFGLMNTCKELNSLSIMSYKKREFYKYKKENH